MELLTHELRQTIPPLGSTDTVRDPMVLTKFFHPGCRWYVIEASAIAADGRHVPLSDPAADVVGLAQSDLRSPDWTPKTPVGSDERRQPGDIEFFGLVDMHEAELGYFFLSELQQLAGAYPYFAPERDRYTFEPCRLSELRTRIERGEG